MNDKDFADILMKINMYKKIEYKFFFTGYNWKRLERARKILADLFYEAVSTRGHNAFWKGKTVEHLSA